MGYPEIQTPNPRCFNDISNINNRVYMNTVLIIESLGGQIKTKMVNRLTNQ